MADYWQLPEGAVDEQPPTPITGLQATTPPVQSQGYWQLPAGAVDEAPPSPIMGRKNLNPTVPESLKPIANIEQGFQNIPGAAIGIPHVLSSLFDLGANKVGLYQGPSTVTQHTISPSEVTNFIARYGGPVTDEQIIAGQYDPAIAADIVKPKSVYQAETLPGKIVQDLIPGAALAAPGAGGLLSLGAREAMNLGSTVAADTAAAVAPDSPGIQLLAGALGMLPGARIEGPLRPTFTGSTTKAQQLQQAFNDLDIPSNVFTTSQGPVSKTVINAFSRLPGTAGPVERSMAGTLESSGERADQLAGRLGTAATTEEGGNALRTGITNYRDAFQKQAGDLYDTFTGTMDQTRPVDLTNTRGALAGPIDRFPSNPALGQAITNPTLQKYLDLLSPRTTEIPAKFSPILDQTGNPILTQAAQKLQTGGTLSFPELQEFRSKIGRDISDPMLINDIPRADLKGVYAGISRDLENAATQQGPEALAAFRNANSYYQNGMNVVDQLEPLLSGSAEHSFAALNAAAGKTGSGNAALLQTLKDNIPSNDWSNVGASVLRRMGEPTAGAHDAAGPAFSTSTFTTNWSKLSDNAKDLVFGPNTTGSVRSDLEKLVQVTNAQKNVAKFANHSNTANHVGIGGLMMLGLEHVPEMLANPRTIIPKVMTGLAAYGGANAVGRALMTPGFSRWLYRTSDLNMPQAWEQALRQLVSTSRLNPALQPIASQLATTPAQ